MSTDGRPTLADSMWHGEGAMYNGVPTGVKDITNPEALNGSWKAMIIIDP